MLGYNTAFQAIKKFERLGILNKFNEKTGPNQKIPKYILKSTKNLNIKVNKRRDGKTNTREDDVEVAGKSIYADKVFGNRVDYSEQDEYPLLNPSF